MPLDTPGLIAGLTRIFLYEDPPRFSMSMGLTSSAHTAAAWAKVLVDYANTASVAGLPLTPPGSMDAKLAGLQTALTAVFPTPASLLGIVNGLGDLFLVPPAVFGPYVVTEASASRASAIAAILAMPPSPDPVGAANSLAVILDGMVKAFSATMPGPPPVVAPLV